MNKDVLTLLGCSGSLAFMLLTSHAANARKVPPQYQGIASITPTASAVNPILSQEYPPSPENPQTTSLNPNSETIEQLAILKFGCDCPGCRVMVAQMVQNGTLSFPK